MCYVNYSARSVRIIEGALLWAKYLDLPQSETKEALAAWDEWSARVSPQEVKMALAIQTAVFYDVMKTF